jgi:YHS domain-containing protein
MTVVCPAAATQNHRQKALAPLIASFAHQDALWRAAFRPDGAQILTASWDKTGKLWDAASGKLIASFPHQGIVWDPAQNNTGSEPILVHQNTSPKESKSSNTAKVSVDSKGVILMGYDAVAYFKQGKPVKGNPGIESTYQGATYLFASTADKFDFDKDSAKYVPQYGGFCAYGVANGAATGIADPDAFVVYKGKLYLCGNQAALRSFKSNIDSNIDKADTNWRRLTGS